MHSKKIILENESGNSVRPIYIQIEKPVIDLEQLQIWQDEFVLGKWNQPSFLITLSLSLSFSQNQNSENSFHPPFLSLSPRSKGVKAGPRRDILKQFLPTSLLFSSTLSLTLPTQTPFLLSKEEGEEERKTRFSIGNRRNRVFPRSAPILSNNRFLVKE